jgi:hypothetical protein
VGLIPNLGDFIPQPDPGLIPNLGDFLTPQPAPAPPPQPANPGGVPCAAPAAFGAGFVDSPCIGVPGGGYLPFPPGLWDPMPLPGMPGVPMPVPA